MVSGTPFLEWYCRPDANRAWIILVKSAFGGYTPCATETIVVSLSHLVLWCLICYRIYLIRKDLSIKRFCLQSRYYNYGLALVAAYNTAEPLFRAVMGLSVVNLDGPASLPPFEVVTLLIESITWCTMLALLFIETKIYIREFRWYIRFGVIYVLVGDATLLRLVLTVKDYCDKYVLNLYISEILCQAIFCILLLFYLPNLVPYSGYIPVEREDCSAASVEYEPLPDGDMICPEQHVNFFSKIFFEWMTPLMKLGYQRPITESDVWKLDTWDQTENLYNNFQRCWEEESTKSKPWLLRALNRSLGGRFWFGGLFKIGNDASQFVGPIVLGLLLEAEKTTLSNIHLDISVGSLVAVVGSTGEGKTSLISAMLGEIPAVSETEVVVRGSVAYVPQVSWIFNATVRDNILFGSPYDPLRYEKAIHVSALEHDLQSLPGGDLTEIGERGVNISGGQKQRVSIARAVYANTDVYIFDDPLSALDAHVGRQVFEKCIKDELRGKTQVLVTNQLHFLPHVDRIILIGEGMIKEEGTYEELISHGPLFQKLMENAGKMEGEMEESIPNGHHEPKLSTAEVNGEQMKSDQNPSSKKTSSKTKEGKSVLIKQEERETGVVSLKVLQRYKNALGGLWVVLILLSCYVASEVLRVSSSTWLSVWTDETAPKGHGPQFYNIIYAVLSFGQVLVTLTNSFWLVLSSLYAAKKLHDSMLSSILRAPMSFFQTNPIGRIINRFAKDLGDIDRNVAVFANMFLSQVFQLLSTFILIGTVSTISLWAIMPLLIVFYAAYLYYQSTAREVKRLDSITRSPVYAQFGEALNGLAAIRAYQAYDRMATINGKTMDNNIRFTLVNMSSNRWLGIRLETLGGLMIWLTAIFAVMQNQRANSAAFAPLMGLLLSYTLNITNLLTATLRLASMAENSFNAVERVGTYIELPPEAPLIIDNNRPPPGWPSSGVIEYKKVVMRYRQELPPVIRDVSFRVMASEKVGIVGRTGAGKSSMFNTLFRIVEIESGNILIDECDISKIGLADLRKALGIIPQAPVLFSGTVRFNLDPFGEHNDADLWESLERAHLKDVIRRNSLGLDTEVSEAGDNFSVGQRQLLSLARALLRRSKILVLDEATAAVDVATDALIQRTIREEFRSCTMLVIAHRINTIIDCDRILVLEAGQVLEFDTPENLLSNEDSAFSKMVQSTGSANAQYLRSIVLGDPNSREGFENRATEKKRKWNASARWAAAAQFALALSLTSSQQDLQVIAEGGNDNILQETRNAAQILQDVLQGKHDSAIEEALVQHQVPRENWWSALFKVVEGLAVMSRLARNRFYQDESIIEGRDIVWDDLTI